MKSIVLGVFMAVVLVSAAHAQKKRELSTSVNVNYCLPKVVYQLEVNLERVSYIPGPYKDYAEEELGVKPEIMQASEQWSIVSIEVKPQYLPDEKTIYSLSATNDYTPVMLSLSPEGFLAGVAGGNGTVFREPESRTILLDKPLTEGEIDIMKLNTYNHLKEVLDTNYTFQEIDGEMKKIWDPIVHYVPKSEADNIREMVSEIFRIRSERVKLLSADNGVPEGKSLELILKEFDQMEANYLSLFMGKKVTQKVKRVVTCIPVKADEPVVAFRFSEKEGITDSKDVSALAYLLRITNVVVPASAPAAGETAGTAIYYRVPATGDVQLLKGKEVIDSFPGIVPQLGEIKRFPVDVISNEGLTLEFYPQFGALKSVKKLAH